jgi:hypothetical protein
LSVSLALNALLLALLWHGMSVRDTRADVGATEELTPHMEIMQHLSHKLGLAIQARNQPLAAFYLEEIHETTEVIQKKFPTYDKHDIAELMGAMLVPSIDPLKKSINAKSWAIANAGYTKLLDSCNDCHAATDHEFVKITAPTANPFNQAFSLK